MAKLESIPQSDKDSKGFSESLGHERHHRAAMTSLRDIIVFHHAVKKEMQVVEDSVARGGHLDRDLYKKMVAVDETYKAVMSGFMHLNDDEQRHALITFSDAVKDLMGYVHHKRKH